MSKDEKKEEPKRKKVAIVGYAPHRKLAPYDDESFEIWGINDLFMLEDMKRRDRWFQLHHPTTVDNYQPVDKRLGVDAMLAEYAKWDCPVYMHQRHPDVPNSEVFPFMELVEEFGYYFNNTISWLIAFAMHEGFEEIHIYGVDMASHSEYSHQKPSCEYFIGLARGRGIEVYIPDGSSLLKVKYLYALEVERENVEKKNLEKRLEFIQQQYAAAEKAEAEAREQKQQIMGAGVVIRELLMEL